MRCDAIIDAIGCNHAMQCPTRYDIFIDTIQSSIRSSNHRCDTTQSSAILCNHLDAMHLSMQYDAIMDTMQSSMPYSRRRLHTKYFNTIINAIIQSSTGCGCSHRCVTTQSLIRCNHLCHTMQYDANTIIDAIMVIRKPFVPSTLLRCFSINISSTDPDSNINRSSTVHCLPKVIQTFVQFAYVVFFAFSV
jgi:hypothetical protein